MTVRVVPPPDLLDRVPPTVLRTPGSQRLHRISAAAPADRPVPLHHAMRVLIDAGLPAPEQDLREVALDSRERATDRVSAVSYLGRIGSATALDALAAALRQVQDQRLLAATAQALGGLADERLLPEIETAGRRATGRAGAVLGFAATLIAHRLGLTGHPQPAVPADRLLRLDGAPSQELTVRPATPAEAEQGQAGLAQAPLRISLDGPGFHLTCGRNTLLILLSGNLGIPALTRRNLLAGVIATPHPSLPEYVVARVLLTSPTDSGDRVRLGGYRLDGSQDLAGEATAVTGRLAFRLQAVDRPGAVAIDVQGDYDGGLRLSTGASALTARPGRAPTRSAPRPGTA